MKPWIFWTGQVPEITGYDKYAAPIEETPRSLRKVRIVIIEAHKYVIEVEFGKSALGEVTWMDAQDMDNVDPAMVLEACLLDMVARRNALGWITRDEMPSEPQDDAPREVAATSITDLRIAVSAQAIQEDDDKPIGLPRGDDGKRVRKSIYGRSEDEVRQAMKATAEPSEIKAVSESEPKNETAGATPLNDESMEVLATSAYEARCRKKFSVEGVTAELKLNQVRGRILRAFDKGVGQTLHGAEIAKIANCGVSTVANYCGDYQAAGWVKRGDDGWTLLRAIPNVEPDESVQKQKPAAWTNRQDQTPKNEISVTHPDNGETGSLYQIGEWWRFRDSKGKAHSLGTDDPEKAWRLACQIMEGKELMGDQPWGAKSEPLQSPTPARPSSNGGPALNASAPLADRVVEVLSRGPQKFDKLAGTLVVGIKPLSAALADLIGDGRVVLKGTEYRLDDGT